MYTIYNYKMVIRFVVQNIVEPYICGVARNTRRSGCTVGAVLLSVYGHFRQFLGGHALGAEHLKCIILFANVTSLKGAVTSHVMSQCCTCIGHMTFYYKRSADTSVGGSCLFVRSSGLTLSPETHMWLVPNVCRSRCVYCTSGLEPTSFNSNYCISFGQ